jgi:hypothetical protein
MYVLLFVRHKHEEYNKCADQSFLSNCQVASLKMNEIIGIKEPSNLYEIYDQIFTERSGFEISFTSRIKKRGFLYPIDFKLGGKEAQALKEAAKYIGDDEFYISLTERSDKPNKIQDWLVPFDKIESYIEEKHLLFIVLANTLYSTNARWGIFLCVDGFGAIGGSSKFIDAFYYHLGITNTQIVQRLIQDTREDIAYKVLSRYFAEEEVRNYIGLPQNWVPQETTRSVSTISNNPSIHSLIKSFRYRITKLISPKNQ